LILTSTPGSLQHFQEIVDASRSRVARLPHRIWLFGGQFADDSASSPRSLRDAFYRSCHQRPHSWIADIARPEDYPDWLAFSGYEDLLLFERDAGFLSRAVVLFVESEGAIAELGAFALDEQLHKKLFVVISRKYREPPFRQSFLNLGPLKRIESSKGHDENAPSGICVIEAEKPSEITDAELDLIFRTLDEWLTLDHASERFRKDNPTHRLLLIADLVDVLQVLSERQLIDALKHFGVDLDRTEVRKSAQLLDLMGLVRLSERGNEKFLVTLRARGTPLLEYDAVGGQRFDRLSFKTKAWQLVSSDSHVAPLLKSAV
jgi:hypothetical protein